jgi:hypothetical protein
MPGLQVDGLDNDLVAESSFRHANNRIVVDLMSAGVVSIFLKWPVGWSGIILRIVGRVSLGMGC